MQRAMNRSQISVNLQYLNLRWWTLFQWRWLETRSRPIQTFNRRTLLLWFRTPPWCRWGKLTAIGRAWRVMLVSQRTMCRWSSVRSRWRARKLIDPSSLTPWPAIVPIQSITTANQQPSRESLQIPWKRRPWACAVSSKSSVGWAALIWTATWRLTKHLALNSNGRSAIERE